MQLLTLTELLHKVDFHSQFTVLKQKQKKWKSEVLSIMVVEQQA